MAAHPQVRDNPIKVFFFIKNIFRSFIFVDDEYFQADVDIKEIAMKPVVMKEVAQLIQRALSRKADRRNKTAEAG